MTVKEPDISAERTLIQEKIEQPAIQRQEDAVLSKPIEDKEEENPNWKAFREARKKDKAEREAAEKRAAEKQAEAEALKSAMEALLNKSGAIPTHPNQYYQEQSEETEDERIEKKVHAAIAKREAESEKIRREREQQELPQRLVQAFPDYHQVVNEENGAYLEYHHPELYRSLLRQPENFETLSDVYKVVKKFVPNIGNAKKEAAKAENNFNKPRSISSSGITPTGETRSSAIVSQEKRDANYARMQKIIKGVG